VACTATTCSKAEDDQKELPKGLIGEASQNLNLSEASGLAKQDRNMGKDLMLSKARSTMGTSFVLLVLVGLYNVLTYQ
jgi:hypothetical protein